MLGKLFKRSGLTRAEDVQALSREQDSETLRALVLDAEVDPPLRVTALQHLQDATVAAECWQATELPAALRGAALELLRARLEQDISFLDTLSDWSPVARYGLLHDAWSEGCADWLAWQDEQTCLELAQQAHRPQARHQAAEHIASVDALQALQRQAKGHDKVMYRLAKTRLQNLRAVAEQQAARDQALEQVRQGLQKLVQTTYDPLLEGKLNHLLHKLDDIQPSPEEQSAIEPLANQVRQRLEQVRAERAPAQQASEPEPPATPETVASPPSVEATADPEAGEPAAQEEPAVTPDQTTAAPGNADEDTSTEDPARAEERRHVGAVRSLLRRGRGAVRGGHLRQARGIWRSIEEHLNALSDGHAGLREETVVFHAELQKLADWQSFAVEPKMEQLIAHMRQLCERHMHPQDKADAVQALQKEWRQLSRGSGGQHQDLWDQFHDLAEQAYAPCKEYFAEQAELQVVNASKRRELIDQLHQYYETNDWHNPDWTEVEKVLRLAARDWRHFSPVKPKDHRATEKDYSAIVQRIRDQLNKEYDRNRQERQRIIEAAKALREEDNIRTATEQLKVLQQEWKQSGRTHRKDDQRLWHDFRAVCDDLFARRDEQTQAFKAELEHNLSTALAVIERIEQAADTTDTAALKAALAELPSWEAEFEACGVLPKARVEETRQRFREAVRTLRSARDQQRHARERQTWEALFERLHELARLESAMHEGRFDADQKAAVAQAWADTANLPSVVSQLSQRLQSALQAFEQQQAPQHTEADLSAHQRSIVLLEVLADIESPQADRSLRMEVQVQRLADNMGQKPDRQDMEQALVAWAGRPALLAETEYEPLHERAKVACLRYFSKVDQ
ncbi:DUF349 domain-containing protein [Natronospirillum operosum]|uniref:DUF349 domain-containing protein n=1 Tax=Natronospirillum operosum TaxID=2759953 RepID=A0A4Z0WEG3_9GAMM|nr:DUF349 domain-containing protein [Natronospirillum operosum]TGG92553.1 DUF349 domain-containing protein [Natronospirillum operosum]